jgi:DNA-directed RNA polymerase specialized sigma24 family protein
LPSDRPSPVEELLARERERRRGRSEVALRRAVAGLPAEDRLLVRLRFEQGLGYREIATVVGGPVRMLYRRIEVIIGRLRRATMRRVEERSTGPLIESGPLEI